jgi:hypothetical protein
VIETPNPNPNPALTLNNLTEVLTNLLLQRPDLGNIDCVVASKSPAGVLALDSILGIQILTLHAAGANPDDPSEPPGLDVLAVLANRTAPILSLPQTHGGSTADAHGPGAPAPRTAADKEQ